MSYSAPNPLPYISHAQTNSAPSGPPRRRFPLPAHCPIQFAAYAFDQEFEMVLASFPPAPKNTQSSAASGATFGLSDHDAILTSLSQPSDSGGGLGKFTGSFARVPATWDDFQTKTVSFPAWLNHGQAGAATTNYPQRPQKNVDVTIRTRYEYFVIDPDSVLSGVGVLDSGGNAITLVASKGAIPILYRHPFRAVYSGTPNPFTDTNQLVPASGLLLGTFYLPTLPTLEAYTAWCAVAAAITGTWDQSNPPLWDGSNTGTTFGQYRLTDSRLQDYEGNIVCRLTEYVMPQ